MLAFTNLLCSKKDSALEGTGLVEDLLGDREDILEIQMYGKTHIRFGAHALIFFLSKVSSDTKGRLLSSACWLPLTGLLARSYIHACVLAICPHAMAYV